MDRERRISWHEFGNGTARVANALTSSGLARGDRVVVLYEDGRFQLERGEWWLQAERGKERSALEFVDARRRTVDVTLPLRPLAPLVLDCTLVAPPMDVVIRYPRGGIARSLVVLDPTPQRVMLPIGDYQVSMLGDDKADTVNVAISLRPGGRTVRLGP